LVARRCWVYPGDDSGTEGNGKKKKKDRLDYSRDTANDTGTPRTPSNQATLNKGKINAQSLLNWVQSSRQVRVYGLAYSGNESVLFTSLDYVRPARPQSMIKSKKTNASYWVLEATSSSPPMLSKARSSSLMIEPRET